MVVAANPLAAEAGLTILRQGGSAVDAGIAVQMVLGLVEPQSSGIGGGALLVHYSAADRTVRTYDGRETAPAAVKADFPRPPAVGGGSVGVPGLLRAVEMAHRAHGRLPWANLFAPATTLARAGFPVSPRLHRQLGAHRDLARIEPLKSYFYRPDGTPKAVGTLLVNTPYAEVLRLVATSGPEAFYRGDVARDIVTAVRNVPGSPGPLTEADLASYSAKERGPVCGGYRSYTICSMGPPSSGGVALLQILGILQHFDLRRVRPTSVEAAHLLAEAERLAFADRGQYLADPDFVPVPVRGLLDPAYLQGRAGLIKPDKAMGRASPGQPPEARLRSWSHDASTELPSTSHIAVVDAGGNALSMTSTIEATFGSRLMVRGFLLNNQLTDFSIAAPRDGKPPPNRMEPGKRPRSSMAPLLVFGPDAKLLVVVGSAGGSAIINDVAKTLVGVLDWGLDIQQAIALPNLGSRGGATELEQGTAAATLQAGLESMGHRVVAIPLESGLHGILATPSGLLGGADPRREGIALGE
jgi:gamma-glutamyltranspeptidase/glutathione hydrolase